MYPGSYALKNPDRAAFIMAGTGEVVSYAEFEQRSNRLAHLLRAQGLKRLDHYAIFMENNDRYLESCAAGERCGLYYTCVNSFLTADELAYILQNSESQLLICSYAKLDVAMDAIKQCPRIKMMLVCGQQAPAQSLSSLPKNEGVIVQDFVSTCAAFPSTPIADESLGTPMLYSSGTTGRPKGILRPLPANPPSKPLALFDFLSKLWRYREDMMYLSPAPLYHSAPQAAVSLTIRIGGTVVIMEKFDPIHYLSLIARYKISHTQLVPTMFSRMLKLSDEERRNVDLSSLEVAIHAAAPCPPQVKEAMIAWWGPIIHEYYGATEGLGFTACDTEQWLSHRGSVGKVLFGDLHILDEAMRPCAKGEPGTVWFKTGSAFEYFNDPQKTQEATSPDGTMTTVGDVGYVDDDGYLYLTDRATFMIISGGVNIYPQECENLLITHPSVADAAVFGVPNADLGEEVKAVVQLMPGVESTKATEDDLLAFCRSHLSIQKCPRSIDFEESLPRLPTGKLYKRILRDRYWGNKTSRIV
jgi:long-chain acyl-CoA synthetase